MSLIDLAVLTLDVTAIFNPFFFNNNKKGLGNPKKTIHEIPVKLSYVVTVQK
jgi:hypothetical protein